MFKRLHLIPTTILALTLWLTGCSTATDNASSWKDIHEGYQLEGTLSNVSIKTDVFSVYVEESPDQAIHMNVKNVELQELEKNSKLTVKQSDHELAIVIKGKQKVNLDILSSNKLLKAELHLQLPSQTYKDITMKSDVGTISLNKITAEKLAITNSVGRIIVQDIDAQKTTIRNSVGPIQIHANQVSNDMDVKTELGNIEISFNKIQDNIKLNLSTELGKIDSNLNIVSTSKSSRKLVGERGSSGPELKAQSSIGNISITE